MRLKSLYVKSFRRRGGVRTALLYHNMSHNLPSSSVLGETLQFVWHLMKESLPDLFRSSVKMKIKGPGTCLQLRSTSPRGCHSPLKVLSDILGGKVLFGFFFSS